MSVTFTIAGYVDSPTWGGRVLVHRASDLAVNVSNDRAAEILERLGLDVDVDCLVGEIDPDDMLGRAMTAGVGRDDTGSRTVTDRIPGRATMVDVGVRVGYFEQRMAELAELATEAKRVGAVVAWA